MAKELVQCPKCEKITSEVVVYKSPEYRSNLGLEKVLGKYHLNSTVAYECNNCGYRYN